MRQFSANNRGYSSNLKVTTQHCEDTETEVCTPHHVETLLCSHPIEFVCVFCSQPDCFLGCAFGNRNGGTYRFLLPEVDNRFTKARCKLSIHPRCACRNSAIASRLNLQPPPPPAVYTEEWNIVQLPFLNPDGRARDTSRGAVGAMTQRLVNGRTLDLSLRSGPMHSFQCPLDDDGHETCALTCASEHLSRLRAFTVTGEKCVFDDLNPHSNPYQMVLSCSQFPQPASAAPISIITTATSFAVCGRSGRPIQ